MITVRDLRVDAGIRTLISSASFTIQRGDKVGLVGRNGAGKTTLLKTLAGEQAPTDGRVLRSGRLGYFSQEAALDDSNPELTALERILSARSIGDLLHQIELARRRIAATSGVDQDQAIRRFSRLQDELETRGGFAVEAEAKRTAAAVGVTSDELGHPLVAMSGGQRRRVELARILFAETDILLLDEPTNHLDGDAKAWLMEYLDSYTGALLMVSHDLPLLDASISEVIAFEDGRLEAYRGTYSYYLTERQRRQTQRERIRRHQEQRIAQLENTVARFIGTTDKMAKRARGMRTRAERLKKELTETQRAGKRVAVAFPQPEASGRIPIEAIGLAKEFGTNVVFVDVDVYAERGERLMIMGLNGAGKTTLLRILAGEETADLGEVLPGHNTSIGYYAQEHEKIHHGQTVMDHMRAVSDQPDQTLRTLLGHFLLAEKISQNAGTLSGGEKTKLALAQLVASRPNVLLLDEPTNNLDPQAKEALLLALHQYAGTVVLVSHDTAFVGELAPDRAVLMPEGESVYFDESMLDLVALA